MFISILMFKNLPENINLPQLETEIIQFWKENDIFNKSVNSRPENKRFTFYEGPPTANGLPGIHHVISRSVKDIMCRYKTMQGFRVYRKAGWDTHGLPVEIEVEKKLGIKSKSEIEEFGVVAFNNACKDSIFTYRSEWEKLTERMGYWIDLSIAYVTYHNEYIESVWWALKKFFDDDLIYKGYKIIPFCPVCESSLSSHEVAQGYEDLKDPSVYVKFKITSGKYKDSDFLVWTTTPWTLPSNAALSVNPEFTYVLIETEKNDKLILAKERLSAIKEEYKVLEEINGVDLEYTDYEPLFNYFKPENKTWFVTLGDFVTMEDGSGIVHIAPAFGEDDYQIGLKYKLPVFQAVGTNGRFKDFATDYAGKNFKEADQDIMNDLKSRGRLYRKEMFVHSYPHCWRHHVPLMYYATDTWFIRTTDFKNEMIKNNKKVHWHPEEFGVGRFGNWLEENRDWALSRNRFWGTPLPVWYYLDDEGKPYYECIGSLDELKSKAVNFDEVYPDGKLDLHKPFIDDLILKSQDGKEMKRVTEVIDCWFDSGSMPFAQHHYPFENKELFENNFPADFIAEGLDQTRGWFYSLHAISTFLFKTPAYKNLIVNGLILDKTGKKMSKSIGNVVNPFEMMDKYGADVLRWYLISSSPIGKSKLFNEDDLIDVKNKFFDTLINTYKFFVIYANLNGFKYDNSQRTDVKDRNEIDRWIISRFNTLKRDYFDLMDGYDITKASRIVAEFTLDELSNWYVRRNRKRFRNPANEKDKQYVFQTLYEVFIELIKMTAPFSPFLAEKLYLNLSDNFESIHLSEFTLIDENSINRELEEEMYLAQRVVSLVRAMRVKNNLKIRQPLKQILIPVLNSNLKNKLTKVKNIILEEVNIKELNLIEGDSDIIIKKAKPDFKVIGPKYGKDVKTVQKSINSLSNDEIKEIELNGYLEKDNFKIHLEDIEIYTEKIEGWIVESENDITVALDTRLDDSLLEEGYVREFINKIQNFRKNNDFAVNDKIILNLKSSDYLIGIINKNIDYIKSETSITDITSVVNVNGEKLESAEVNNELIEFSIKKV